MANKQSDLSGENKKTSLERRNSLNVRRVERSKDGAVAMAEYRAEQAAAVDRIPALREQRLAREQTRRKSTRRHDRGSQ